MAKNVLTIEKRFQLQEYLKKAKRMGFVNMNCVEDICNTASTYFGFPISPVHIRKNALLLGIQLPRKRKNGKDNGSEGLNKQGNIRKSFTCPCGRRYSMGVYYNHNSGPAPIL